MCRNDKRMILSKKSTICLQKLGCFRDTTMHHIYIMYIIYILYTSLWITYCIDGKCGWMVSQTDGQMITIPQTLNGQRSINHILCGTTFHMQKKSIPIGFIYNSQVLKWILTRYRSILYG